MSTGQGAVASSAGANRAPGARPAHEAYMPLVRRIAMRTVRSLPSSISYEDVVSAGWVGMAEALQRRTPAMDEERFEAYASYRVRGAILDYLRTLDPLTRKLRGASRRITQAVSNLTQRLGRSPDEEEVAGELGLTLLQYQELLGEISDAGYARLEIGADIEPHFDAPSPELQAQRTELVGQLAGAIEKLPERVRLVLGLYYQEGCNLRQIGEVLGVTESRVCQIHSEAVHLLRSELERTRPVRKK